MADKPVIDFPQTLVQGASPATPAPAVVATGDEGFDFAQYLNVLRRHKWGILGIALLATLYGAFKAMQETPLYRATLTMLIEPHQPKIVNIQQLYLPINSYLFYETQTQIIKSRAVAERVVDKLRLDERADYEVSGRPVTRSLLQRLMAVVGFGEVESAGQAPARRLPLTPEDRARRRAALVARIQGGLGVWSSQKSQIFTISYVSPDPQFAADVANAVAEAYVDFTLESKLTEAKHASNWLTERLEELRKKVIESEAELHAFQSKEGMIDTQSIKQLESGRLTTFNAELIEAQTRYAELAKRYGPKHPKMIAAKAELEEARRRLQVEEEKILEAKRKANMLEKLERNVATNRQLYELFMTRFKETDIATDEKATNARILDPAQVPSRPFKPNKMQIISSYFGIGLMLGVLLAFLREYLDNTFKTPGDVEDRLKLPVLGIIPLLAADGGRRGHSAQKATPERHYIDEPRSSFAESVNHIRTGILFTQVDNPPKTVMVTSSVQSEGKTTLASNLALSFSQLGRTLLLDADLRKPRVAQIAGLDKQAGLVDLVAGQKTMRECIVRDRQAENLYILRTGTMPPNPLELLSSDRFAGVLEELKQNFNHIVIDTAPVLPVSDAIVLGHVVDALVMVIQADRTSKALALDAIKRLRHAKVAPVGVVLSQVSQRKISQYYYDRYYYDSYYSSYHAYGEASGKKKKRA